MALWQAIGHNGPSNAAPPKGALAMAMPGDATMASLAEVEQVMKGGTAWPGSTQMRSDAETGSDLTMPTPPIRAPAMSATMTPVEAWLASSLMITVIGWFDFFSGSELRVFPLYYAPISLLAWNVGRGGALIAAVLSATAWLVGNLLAGLQYSSASIWAANTVVLALSFAIVGFLISTLKQALLRERGLSRTDPLTSLLNRRAFYEEGGRILDLCRRKKHPVTLAYLDLDNFKSVNDVLGHEAGDNMLRSVADILRASTRPSDICVRLGGDEFALLLPEADRDEAMVALERLRRLVSERLASPVVPVTCSLGAVAFLEAPEHMEEMIAAADSHMYVAKAAGKNRLHLEVADRPSSGGKTGRSLTT